MYTRQHCVHEMISVTCFFFGLDTAAYSGLHGCYPSTRRAQVAAHPKRKDAVSKVRIMMHQKFPDKVPKMIAYMLTILQAQQEFEDPGWRIAIDSRQQHRATKTGQRWTPIYTVSVSQVRQRRSSQPVPSVTPSGMSRKTASMAAH